VGGDLKTPQDFLKLLNAMRKSKNVSYRQIDERAGAGMSSSTAQAMLAGDTLPSLSKLELFLVGCNVPAEERRRWVSTWHKLNQSAPVVTDTGSEARGTAGSTTVTSQTTGHDAPPAPSSRPPAPPAPQSPLPAPPTRRQSRRGADMRRLRFALRALTAFILVVGVLTASAILMWVHQVPTEIMFAVYGLLALSVTSWTMVAQRYPPAPVHARGEPAAEEPAVVNEPSRAAKPIIGQ
jgi:hypothetical protein